jgi:hypothetical protein
MKRTTQVMAGILCLAYAALAAAQAVDERESQTAARIASHYVELAGSEDNALALVLALRSGDMVKLVAVANGMDMPELTTFEPPAGAMSWDEVDRALAAAQKKLAHARIAKPSPSQLQAALLGGELRRAQ